MMRNKYDDDVFFNKYSQMERSLKGLTGAGEWAALKDMLPDFQGKRVLDLGCGFGWHCVYAAEHGAAKVVGVDISRKMLDEAARKSGGLNIDYIKKPLEEVDYPADSFDVVLSSLALHYVASFGAIVEMVHHCLSDGGQFIFSMEHPIFTASGPQDWHYDGAGDKLHWPVDRYFEEGPREAVFLGEKVLKYHRTLTTIIRDLRKAGFEIDDLVEPQPNERMLKLPEMTDELRRPMMLLIAARKQA
ncbi:SAM-dependent methyltransferase [Deltaproteobacteria bacterium Smac51]|nr:SAM-dependent methyltransferase [Deltaproteobacteria bacterium Smac51]